MGEKEIYRKSARQVMKDLDTNTDGLLLAEAEIRLKRFGRNTLKQPKKNVVLKILARQFSNLLIYILLFAAAVSFFVGEKIEFIVISSIVVIIASLGFIQEFRAEKAMAALKDLESKKARVLRGKKVFVIDSKEVVVGDIIILETGDHVPADARIISQTDLYSDESAITGESDPVRKDERTINTKSVLGDRSNMLFTGSYITNGNCRAVVIATGMQTEIGKLASLMQEIKDEKSPLQEKFDSLSKNIGFAVIGFCLLMFMIGILQGKPILSLLITVAAVAVSGIPESLPAVLTVTLASGIRKMAADKAIIKRMFAVETLGCTSVICTDKTGTLTQNQMSAEFAYTYRKEYSLTGSGYDPGGHVISSGKPVTCEKDENLKMLSMISLLCNNSDIIKKDGKHLAEGDPTEAALIIFAKKAKAEKKELEKRYPRIREIAFTCERKFMSTVHKDGRRKIVMSKGAPEVLLEKCSRIKSGSKIVVATDERLAEIMRQAHVYANKGLRVLGLAYKPLGSSRKKATDKMIENDLIFCGIIAMRDPPRHGVKQAIAMCEDAGIKVVMITGDHEITARTIARELGIYKEQHKIMTGEELNSMSDYDFRLMVENITVYARVSPEHKIRIVKALQEKGHVVAMTGDGVNDAPALKKADIGIAMGEGGTDVARESADMILLDDHFASIVDAIKQGRTIFENIKKFVYYLLTGNLSEVILVFVALALGMDLPLTGLMILFVNLVTSELPAIGLSLEPPFPNVMRQKPRDKNEFILDDYLMLKIAQLIPLIVLGTITLFTWQTAIQGEHLYKARTVAFASIIFFELFHVFNAKAFKISLFDSKPFSNWMIDFTFITSAGLTLLAIFWPPAQEIFHTVPLTGVEMAMILLMASSLLFYVEIQESIVKSEIKEWRTTGG